MCIIIFRLGFNCPPEYNPADFYVKLISEKNSKITLKEYQITNDYRQNCQNVQCYQAIDFTSYNNNKYIMFIYENNVFDLMSFSFLINYNIQTFYCYIYI